MFDHFYCNKFLSLFIFSFEDIRKISSTNPLQFDVFIKDWIFFEIVKLFHPIIPKRFALEYKLPLRVDSITVSELDAKLILSVDGGNCKSLHVDDIFGQFADFVREDKDGRFDKLQIDLFFVKVGDFFGTALNPRG